MLTEETLDRDVSDDLSHPRIEGLPSKKKGEEMMMSINDCHSRCKMMMMMMRHRKEMAVNTDQNQERLIQEVIR